MAADATVQRGRQSAADTHSRRCCCIARAIGSAAAASHSQRQPQRDLPAVNQAGPLTERRQQRPRSLAGARALAGRPQGSMVDVALPLEEVVSREIIRKLRLVGWHMHGLPW